MTSNLSYFHIKKKCHIKQSSLLCGCLAGVSLVTLITMSNYSAQIKMTYLLPSCVCLACVLGFCGDYSYGLTKDFLTKIILTDYG